METTMTTAGNKSHELTERLNIFCWQYDRSYRENLKWLALRISIAHALSLGKITPEQAKRHKGKAVVLGRYKILGIRKITIAEVYALEDDELRGKLLEWHQFDIQQFGAKSKVKDWKVTVFILGEYEKCDPVKFTDAQNGDYQSYYTEDEFKNVILPRKTPPKGPSPSTSIAIQTQYQALRP